MPQGDTGSSADARLEDDDTEDHSSDDDSGVETEVPATAAAAPAPPPPSSERRKRRRSRSVEPPPQPPPPTTMANQTAMENTAVITSAPESHNGTWSANSRDKECKRLHRGCIAVSHPEMKDNW
jgi:hypothetical protein